MATATVKPTDRPLLAGSEPQGNVALARAGVAERDDVLVPLDVLAAGEIHHQRLVQGRQGRDIPVEYDEGGRGKAIMNLLLLELRAARSHVLAVPFPAHAGLARRCRGFLEDPSTHGTIDEWAAALAMSRRAFTRLFRSETGLSLAEWQRQVAVLQAVHKITDGEPITSVALDLGYTSPAAFTSMFKRVMGMPPSWYVTHSSRKIGDRG